MFPWTDEISTLGNQFMLLHAGYRYVFILLLTQTDDSYNQSSGRAIIRAVVAGELYHYGVRESKST